MTESTTRQQQHQNKNKYLSFSAILCIAANTMNGPALTTLPTVAADAGLLLYTVLIVLSVAMAAFVCRRLVYAMWNSSSSSGSSSSLRNYHEQQQDESSKSSFLLVGGAENEDDDSTIEQRRRTVVPNYSSISNTTPAASQEEESESDIEDLLILSVSQDEVVCDGEPDEFEVLIPTPSPKKKKKKKQFDFAADDDTKVQQQQQQQPSLKHTSIVGQSREAYGRKTSIAVAFIMVASALCLALAQMMLCAAILDGMFVALAGQTCALGWPSPSDDDDYGSSSSSWIYCTSHTSMKPFANNDSSEQQEGVIAATTTTTPMSLLSFGWIVAATASVIMGTVDLDEMMSVQYFLFACLVVSAVRFSFVLTQMSKYYHSNTTATATTTFMTSDDDEVNTNNTNNWFAQQQQLLGPHHPFQTIGPIMFNFAFVVTSPPSSAMARSEKSAYRALGWSCVVMGILYAMVGLTGASVSNIVREQQGEEDSNLLSLILLSGGDGDDGPAMIDLVMIGLFGFSTVASIPVYCLLAKETLIHDAGVAPFPSFLLSNVLPWILVAVTYNAAFFEAFVNWSGLLILGYANFSLPLVLDLKLMVLRRRGGVSKMTVCFTQGVLIVVTVSITLVIVMSLIT